MNPKLPKIADSEWRVMKILWQDSPKTANEIVVLLSEKTSWKSKTIKTLINRLVKKEALGYDKKGKEYHYYPILNEVDCARAERISLLKKVYDGALQPMLAAFIEEQNLSAEEIEALKRILVERQRKK